MNEQYNYGWFVPFFALYLFWLRWEDRPTGESRKEKVGSRKCIAAIVITIFVLLLLLPVRVFEIGNPDWRPLGWIHAAAVATLTLIYIWYAGGKPWLRHFAFPIAFFFVAVPWISPVEEPIMQGLMRAVAAVAAETVTLFGIPAQLQGNLIRLSSGLVGVNEACSGVRSLQTSLMIGLLFGELKRLSILHRLVLVAGAIFIALAANFLRAIFLVWIAASKGLSETNRWHDSAGYIIVGLVVIGSIVLASLLGRQKVESRIERVGRPQDGRAAYEGERTGESESKSKVGSGDSGPSALRDRTSSFILHPSSFAAALFWLIAVEFAAAGWYRAHEHNLISRSTWKVSWDRLPSGFRAIKIAEDVRQTLRFDEGREVFWQTSDPSAPELSSTDYLFFFRWEPGGSSVVRARAHRPDICLPSAGWEQIADRGAKNYVARDGTVLPVRHIAFKREGRRGVAHAFFCLQEDKVHSEEPRPDLALAQGVQPDWSMRGRTEAVKNGVRNLGQQVLEVVILSAQPLDDGKAEEKFATIVRDVIKAELKSATD